MLKIICIFITTIILLTNARADDLYFLCPVTGNYKNYGLSGDQKNLLGDFAQEVIVTIGVNQKIPLSMFIKTTNDGSGLFRTQFIGATIGNNLTVQDTVISIENSFVRDISNWTQRASLNRITLFLEVQVSREYIKPPPEGLIINYSGTCSPTNKKI